MGFDVAVHDSLAVAVVESLEDLEHVVADVEVIETLVEFAEIGVASINEFCDDGRSLGQGVARDANHVDNVGAALEGLEDLELTTNFLLFNCRSQERDE